MNQRVLEIVFFLIDVLKENQHGLGDISSLSADLRDMGYGDEEISRAYRLIAGGYDLDGDTLFSSFPDQTRAVRVLTPEERGCLTVEAQGFLMRLLHSGVIDLELFEAIIEQATFSGAARVDVDYLKEITARLLTGNATDAETLSGEFDAEASRRLN